MTHQMYTNRSRITARVLEQRVDDLGNALPQDYVFLCVQRVQPVPGAYEHLHRIVNRPTPFLVPDSIRGRLKSDTPYTGLAKATAKGYELVCE